MKRSLDWESVIGLVLAGGRSRRMFGEDGDKGLLDLCGQPMIARVIERMRPQVSRVVLNANGDPSRYATFGLPIVADASAHYDGPLAGVLAGMGWARAETPDARWIATAPADSPFLPENAVRRLREEIVNNERTIAFAASNGRAHYAVALWPVALADDLAAFLASGERKAGSFAARHVTVAVAFSGIEIGDKSIDPFFNVNTPEDMEEARLFHGLLAERAP